MRKSLIVLWMLLCSIASAGAQVSVGIAGPGVSIGINLPVYPDLVRVPDYPVYYAPRLNYNYFFYDGMYWVYQGDNWYASTWYNGPWAIVAPDVVPLFILRVPVRYYRQPPVYFRGWQSNAPPRWGEHWGNSWEQSRGGWDNWNRRAVPAPAPLPVYQRQYSGNRYPRAEQQQVIQSRNYRYEPRDAVVRQQYQAQRMQAAPAPSPQGAQGAQGIPQGKSSPQQDHRGATRPPPVQQSAPPAARVQPPQRAAQDVARPAAAQPPPQQAKPTVQRQMQPPPQAATQRQMQPPPQAATQRQPPPPPPGATQHQPSPPPGATQRQPPPPGAQGQDKGPQGKGSAQQPQRQRKDAPKAEQEGAERPK